MACTALETTSRSSASHDHATSGGSGMQSVQHGLHRLGYLATAFRLLRLRMTTIFPIRPVPLSYLRGPSHTTMPLPLPSPFRYRCFPQMKSFGDITLSCHSELPSASSRARVLLRTRAVRAIQSFPDVVTCFRGTDNPSKSGVTKKGTDSPKFPCVIPSAHSVWTRTTDVLEVL